MTTRRELLVALGALAVPLAGVAQPSRVPKIGYLDIANLEPALGLFRDGLRQLGYIEGKNIVTEVRSADGKAAALPGLAAELVRLKVDVLVAVQTPAAQAAKQATKTIPVVILAGDPVGTGLVASLSRPGGNVTGVSGTTAELAAKMLELIREIFPPVTRVAVLANVADPFTKPFLEQIHAAGRALSMEIHPAMVRVPADFDVVFAEWAKAKIGAVIIQPSLPRARAIELVLKYRFVSASPTAAFAPAGGLISYAASPRDQYRKLAVYVDKILKGAKPAELPLELPATFELAVNMKTAKALGLTVPKTVLFRADRVIE
ncbi:MAG: ABC transporter substrate-binding protein [Betaproteobacteria bacterium]